MGEPSDAAFDLTTTYVHLEDGGAGTAVPVDADFWPALMSGDKRYPGRLVTASEATADWTHWEMHPAGEELLLLLSGAVEVVMEVGQGERRVALGAGQAFLMPRGVWHRVEVREPGRFVFVTYGEGTQHRPL